jgi:ketosteroid isomerase-like protein
MEPALRTAMADSTLTTEDVRTAAARLVDAFGATDTAAYFDAFAEDATFVFHTEAHRVDTRAGYERLWSTWLAEGWRVVSCRSSNSLIQLLGSTAVFTHDVETVTQVGTGPEETTRERETIVFRAADGTVRAVHEHLSPNLHPLRPEAS